MFIFGYFSIIAINDANNNVLFLKASMSNLNNSNMSIH